MKESEIDQGWVRESLIINPLPADNAAEAIIRLGARLESRGYVKDSWISATIEREKNFPTGLPTAEIGVAIPHADAEHVSAQAIAVGVLEKPVIFGEMGNPGGTVPVQIVCALAAARSELMVTLLQKLVEMFQNPEVLHQIVEVRSPAEVVKIFNQHIPVEEEL